MKIMAGETSLDHLGPEEIDNKLLYKYSESAPKRALLMLTPISDEGKRVIKEKELYFYQTDPSEHHLALLQAHLSLLEASYLGTLYDEFSPFNQEIARAYGQIVIWASSEARRLSKELGKKTVLFRNDKVDEMEKLGRKIKNGEFFQGDWQDALLDKSQEFMNILSLYRVSRVTSGTLNSIGERMESQLSSEKLAHEGARRSIIKKEKTDGNP